MQPALHERWKTRATKSHLVLSRPLIGYDNALAQNASAKHWTQITIDNNITVIVLRKYSPIMGNTIEDLLHMIGGLEMTLRTTFSSGLGACDLRVIWEERDKTRVIKFPTIRFLIVWQKKAYFHSLLQEEVSFSFFNEINWAADCMIKAEKEPIGWKDAYRLPFECTTSNQNFSFFNGNSYTGD